MKQLKAASFNIVFIVILFFASGILNSLIFSFFPRFNMLFYLTVIKVLIIIYLFYTGNFKTVKYHKIVYLGFIILVFTKLAVIAEWQVFISNSLALSTNLLGVLVVGLTYATYLTRNLGFNMLYNFKFWVVLTEIAIAGLMFFVVSGQFSAVQLTWLSFFSMSLLLVILVHKLRAKPVKL